MAGVDLLGKRCHMKCGHGLSNPLLLPPLEGSFVFDMCVAATFNAPLEQVRPTNKWVCTECNYTATAEALLKGLSEEQADNALPEKLRY